MVKFLEKLRNPAINIKQTLCFVLRGVPLYAGKRVPCRFSFPFSPLQSEFWLRNANIQLENVDFKYHVFSDLNLFVCSYTWKVVIILEITIIIKYYSLGMVEFDVIREEIDYEKNLNEF